MQLLRDNLALWQNDLPGVGLALLWTPALKQLTNCWLLDHFEKGDHTFRVLKSLCLYRFDSERVDVPVFSGA